MRTALLVLLALSLSLAYSITPSYLGVKDTGAANLSSMNVGISIDCDNKYLNVSVSDNMTGLPVAGAKLYLFYTDFTYELINTTATGQNGVGSLGVPGNLDYLTKLFILRTDDSQHKSREIEFQYTDCYKPQPTPQPPPQPAQPNTTTNVSLPPQMPQNSSPPQPAPANQSENSSVPAPQTSLPSRSSSICPVALLLVCMIVFSRR